MLLKGRATLKKHRRCHVNGAATSDGELTSAFIPPEFAFDAWYAAATRGSSACRIIAKANVAECRPRISHGRKHGRRRSNVRSRAKQKKDTAGDYYAGGVRDSWPRGRSRGESPMSTMQLSLFLGTSRSRSKTTPSGCFLFWRGRIVDRCFSSVERSPLFS